jgi:TRAP-type mannitol/chloroaromatic compound transport system substrate-binding protein
MDRRSFLKSTGAVATVATAGVATAEPVAAPAIGSRVRELTVAVAWPDAVAGPADDAHRLLHRIVTASEGRYAFRVHPVAPGGATPLEMVANGAADLYFASDNDHVGLDPAFAWFAGLPGRMGLAPDDHEAWLIAAGGELLWDDLAGEHGIKPLLAGHLGSPAGLWSMQPIREPNNLAGLTIAAEGLAREVASGLGATTASGRENSASTIPVQAAQGFGLATDFALGLPKADWRYYAGGLAPAGATVTLGVARKVWDALSIGDRALFAGLATIAWREAVAGHRIQLRPGLDALHHVFDITPKSLPPEVSRHIDGVSGAVVAHAAQSSPRARAIDGSLSAYLTAVGKNNSDVGIS